MLQATPEKTLLVQRLFGDDDSPAESRPTEERQPLQLVASFFNSVLGRA